MEHLPITQSFWMLWYAVETLNIATYSCVPGCMTMKKMSKSIGESDCTHSEDAGAKCNGIP